MCTIISSSVLAYTAVRLLIPFIEARVRSITFDDIRFDVVFIDITFSK